MTQNVKAAGEALKHNLKLQQQLQELTRETSRYILVEKKKRADAKMHYASAKHGKQMTTRNVT